MIPPDAPDYSSPEMIEAYVLDRLSPERRAEMEAWAQNNADAQEMIRSAEARISLLQHALMAGAKVNKSKESLEYLGQYLDKSLSQEDRDTLEDGLAGAPDLQAKLVELYRAGRAANDPSTSIESVERRPDGQQISFAEECEERTRKAEAKHALPEKREEGEEESLKKRFSPGQS